MDELKVVTVGSDHLAHAGLVALLGEQPGIAVAAQLFEEYDVAGAAREAGARMAVWDLGPGPLRPPGAAGLGRLARAVETGIPVLALVHEQEQAAEALAAGARGVLFDDADGRRLAAALGALDVGLLVLDERLAATAIRPAAPPLPALVEPLTPREMEVLQLLPEGLSNRLIAERLGISEHTAKFHVNAILGKLGARTRAEAIAVAARLGLIVL